MDLLDVLLQAGLITSVIVAYLLIFRGETPKRGNYKEPGWNYPLKLIYAWYAVSQWKRKLRRTEANEWPNQVPTQNTKGWDSLNVRATASDGTTLLLGVRVLYGRQLLSEINVYVKLPDGTSYVLPQNPNSPVCTWECYQHGWSANGLKFQVLEPGLRMRITYNGLLTRDDNTTQHAKLNLIWTAATPVVRYPDDWSNELAAKAIAHEPWRDSNWISMLGKNNDAGWLHFGSMQGRFESYDEEGAIDKSVYLQTRGLKERSWTPEGYKELRRSVRIVVSSVDGTVVHLRCLSYFDVLTHCISGSIRFPDFSVESITSTDLIMSHFCETPAEIPKVYSINVSSKKRDLNLVIRVNNDGGKFLSGVLYQQEVYHRTLVADIDGFAGSGVLELGYKSTVVEEPDVLLPSRVLKHISMTEAGEVDYCLPFEDRRAACSDLVGGKGASLALLVSKQTEEDYKVPPGFCITINALNKHLEQNPAIQAAILEIEAANENYEESNFKRKCEATTALFATSAVSGDVKLEILANIAELRAKALDQNLGPDLRFAVRSSAVGEDSEVLSAAGQNETILGCASDDDILRAVIKCWSSMFAFTSAYYRRQNGQACACGGGLAVQTLVAARAAGVLFTRHAAHGDPARMLLTANYGLGESVVSGAVEPDTFIIKRVSDEQLVISKTMLGTKTQRVTVNNTGVGIEDVSTSERETACLSEGEVMRLARLGLVQEVLWGAPRDIEWAVAGNDIFLLQARPITSLERWTEEELLHELDCPIMADDELISFGNTGEVLPRPMTPMSHDVMKEPLTKGIDAIVGKSPESFDPSVVTTHYRCALQLFNSIYRKVPNEIDINIRMIEMSIHGHNVADDAILSAALHRRSPRWYDKAEMILLLIKSIFSSKRHMKSAVKAAKALSVGEDAASPRELLHAIADTEPAIMAMAYDHSVTSTASTCTQFVAMSVLLEGRSEFSPELCNEISALLSSGDVLSAEVPQGLAALARNLEASGKYDEFRALDSKDAMKWLKANLPQVHKEVIEFLEQHGHRAIMEFELLTKPWVLVPEEMMRVLQNLQSTTESKPRSKTDAEMIASLKSPQKDSTRTVLKWVMPLCRRTVRHREGTKAHLILGIHKIRLAFLKLGRLLVKQWYLPNEDLVFFFRFKELRDYIQTRDPGLLRKASQRQQYYPGWCKLKFCEINRGWPRPLQARAPALRAAGLRIEGATVCGGVVVARACVVKDLSEIDQLRQGDILITHATDIGWSPYFPLLTGIVTELGGLISHGAVIAREYGLPCIVGATDATDLFTTGDTVRLSGTNGTLERVVLQHTEQNEQNIM